ncbi:MAG TPA: glycosyltransferase family 2 protein [Thermoanaerobaculia bacterium]|nr:glycosyltransferase family 2 protein [Thermoanaerobaculia bacterium]
MTERIAVIIPAFNAAPLIGPVVRASLEQIPAVAVVDDGSSDGTGEVAAKAGARVLRHERNRGKGAALKSGFAWALDNGYDGVITLDADGQHLPQEIPKFIRARAESGADLIIGGRARHFSGMLPRRRAANRFSAWTISIAAGTPVTDSQSGFRFYSATLLRAFPLRADGFDMESEVIVRAGRGRLRILTIPIDLGFIDGVATSHYRPVKDTLKIAWRVVRTRVRP